MAFTNPQGTYGARQPRGRLLRLVNATVVAWLRRRSGRVLGMQGLVLVTVGRRSGRERATPLGWFDGGNGSWLVVASAAGAARNPAWYLNLAAEPDCARIQVGGWDIPVRAEELHGEERDLAWRTITRAAPRFAAYQGQTDRELPVIRLRPRPLSS